MFSRRNNQQTSQNLFLAGVQLRAAPLSFEIISFVKVHEMLAV